MSAGQEFWMVAVGCQNTGPTGQAEKDDLLKKLKRVSGLATTKKTPDNGAWEFDIPQGEKSLPTGAFDTLIRLTDDLQKYDQQIDSLVHRLERQCLEIDPKASLSIRTQKNQIAFMDYIKAWQWDEHKFPKNRPMMENVGLLLNVVNKLDEESRNKTTQYNEVKTQKANLAKKDNVNLTGRELVDVFTPNVVHMTGAPTDDFIMTEHLTTVCVILHKNTVPEFLNVYESMHENVVPRSAKHFKALDDKDGYTIWRVVLFKNAVEGFKKSCREKRYLVRDFEYDANAFTKLEKQRAEVDAMESQLKPQIMCLYQAAWSDAMVAWVHIKAMRVFVEAVLRFGGSPPNFGSFIVSPTANTAVATRKALDTMFVKNCPKGPGGAKKGEDGDDEEYFPYVSISFVPFATPKGGN